MNDLQKPPAELMDAINQFQLERAQILEQYSTPYSYAKEMDRLSGLIRKYKHRWAFYDAKGERTQQEPSARLCGWVDRYNILTDHALFSWWCNGRGKYYPHDAYDVLA